MIPVLDSNIIIDIGEGHVAALSELKRYPSAAISLISWIEVLVGAKNAAEQDVAIAFMRRFEIIHPNEAIGKLAANIRRMHRLKLPDAVIWATAQNRRTLLVTRDSKDFSEGEPSIRIPYRL